MRVVAYSSHDKKIISARCVYASINENYQCLRFSILLLATVRFFKQYLRLHH